MLQRCPCSPFPAGCQLPPEKDAGSGITFCTKSFNKLFVEPHTCLSSLSASPGWDLGSVGLALHPALRAK